MPKNCQKKNSMVYRTLIVLLDQVFQADSKALKKLITSYKGSAFKVSWYQQPLLLWQQFQPKFNSFWERQGLSKETGGTIQEGFRNLSNFWEHLLLEKNCLTGYGTGKLFKSIPSQSKIWYPNFIIIKFTITFHHIRYPLTIRFWRSLLGQRTEHEKTWLYKLPHGM